MRVAAWLLFALLFMPGLSWADDKPSRGWMNATVGDWRGFTESYRHGMVVGSMNAQGLLGISCRVPLSPNMVLAVLTNEGKDRIPDSLQLTEAVWYIMDEYFGCQLTKTKPDL